MVELFRRWWIRRAVSAVACTWAPPCPWLNQTYKTVRSRFFLRQFIVGDAVFYPGERLRRARRVCFSGIHELPHALLRQVRGQSAEAVGSALLSDRFHAPAFDASPHGALHSRERVVDCSLERDGSALKYHARKTGQDYFDAAYLIDPAARAVY